MLCGITGSNSIISGTLFLRKDEITQPVFKGDGKSYYWNETGTPIGYLNDLWKFEQ